MGASVANSFIICSVGGYRKVIVGETLDMNGYTAIVEGCGEDWIVYRGSHRVPCFEEFDDNEALRDWVLDYMVPVS